MEVKLPEGFALESGTLSWKGAIAEKGTIEIKSKIRAIKLGNWTIEARGGYSFLGGGYFDTDRIYVYVGKDSALSSKEQISYQGRVLSIPLSPSEVPKLAPMSFQGITPKPPQPSAPGSPGTLLVTGTFYCHVSEDAIRKGSRRSDDLVPMVWGWVSIWRASDNAYLGGDITGPRGSLTAGQFSIPIVNPGSAGFYVGMEPWTSAANVMKSDGTRYQSFTPSFYPSPSATSYDIGGWREPDLWDYQGAWRIYETLANDYYDRGAWDFLTNEGPGFTPPYVEVRFKMASGHGTHIHLDIGMIDIDTEDYSRALDIVLHEYGHWVMYVAYNSWFPITYCPSPHYINLYSHPNCGWTEGWADFFPLACQSWERTLYDSVFEWGTGSWIDLEPPTWGTSGWDNGEGVEGRVAGALLDIFDQQSDGYDIWARTHGSFPHAFAEIWDTLRNGGHHNNIDEYMVAWKTRGHTVGMLLAASLWQNTIDYANKGFTRIVLDASPKPGYWNEPMTIFGTLYGTWRYIRDGVVVGKPVTITTNWGFSRTITTDYNGAFSVTTNCPSTGGMYTITATFAEDSDFTGSSASITYEVIAKIPTRISISYVGNRVFQGYLQRADTWAYLPYMPVKLTVTYLYSGAWRTITFDLQTRHDGLWELEFLFYWSSATIVFEGDATYAPSSATITR